MADNRICRKCGNSLEEGQEFCPKCGNKYGVEVEADKQTAINEFNKNVEKSKNKKKRAPFVIGGIVLIAIVGLFVWGLKQADWSFSQLQNITSGKHFSCLVAHSFEDANCEHGMICKECGLERGEKGEHAWVDATCTKAKYCSVCNTIEGDPKGHAVRIGKCNVCGGYGTELWSECNQIYSYYSDAVKNFGDAVEDLQDASYSYYLRSTYVSYAQINLSSAKKNLKKAAEACGSYPEFSDIKTKLTNAANKINTTSSYVSTLANDAGEALECLDGVETQLKEYLK